MAIPQEVTLGVVAESTYKTGVVVTAFYEPTDESLDFNLNTVQGAGLRVGKIGDYSDRRVVPTKQGAGDFTVEAISKGMGKLFQAAAGAGTATLISGTNWMQNFTPGNSPASLTIQKSTNEAGGTADPVTFLGCMCSDWELTFPNAGLVTLKTSWDIGDVATATGLAAASYPSSATLYHWGNTTFASGTYTAGTTTTLATGSTAMANVRSLTVTGKNNLTADRFNGGGTTKSKPIPGKREFGGTIVLEYDSTTFRDAYLAQTVISVIGKTTGATIGASVETLQANLPAIKLDKGIAQANGDGLVTVSHDFTALDDRTNPMVQIQYITLDTAI
jgi:hypothetical protein